MITVGISSVLQRAPLNTNVELIGFSSMGGVARAYFLIMFFFNICALLLFFALMARGQAEILEIAYSGIAVQFSEIILSGSLEHVMGVFSIIPIFVVTVIILIKLCGLTVRAASLIGTSYYIYHLSSSVLLMEVFQKIR